MGNAQPPFEQIRLLRAQSDICGGKRPLAGGDKGARRPLLAQ